MERAGTKVTGRAIAYIKDALDEINIISESHIKTQKLNIVANKRFYKLPNDFSITVLRNCERRQKIFYDLVPINVIKLDNGQYSLIDLESVYNIDKNLSNNLAKDVATIKPSNLLELIKNI